jgi:hypothetical protein
LDKWDFLTFALALALCCLVKVLGPFPFGKELLAPALGLPFGKAFPFGDIFPFGKGFKLVAFIVDFMALGVALAEAAAFPISNLLARFETNLLARF